MSFAVEVTRIFHKAITLVAWWFQVDMAHGVFWGSLLVTFLASVMGSDQQQRLDQGKFGLAAGVSLGGLSGLLKNQPELVVVGFVGSAVGGLIGWLYYLFIALLVSRNAKYKNVVIFQGAGLPGLQKALDLSSKEYLKAGFQAWSEKFYRMLAEEESALLQQDAGSTGWREEAASRIRCWLTSAVDTLALVFGTLADRPDYQSRVTVIVYRVNVASNANPVGKHWISYSGQLKPHSRDDMFDESSIGYKVLREQLESPYFTTTDVAQKEGQRRNDPSYRPFITFRLNDSAILALDWPEELAQDDDYVQSARGLFYSQITPAIGRVLGKWRVPLANEVFPPLNTDESSAQR